MLEAIMPWTYMKGSWFLITAISLAIIPVTRSKDIPKKCGKTEEICGKDSFCNERKSRPHCEKCGDYIQYCFTNLAEPNCFHFCESQLNKRITVNITKKQEQKCKESIENITFTITHEHENICAEKLKNVTEIHTAELSAITTKNQELATTIQTQKQYYDDVITALAGTLCIAILFDVVLLWKCLQQKCQAFHGTQNLVNANEDANVQIPLLPEELEQEENNNNADVNVDLNEDNRNKESSDDQTTDGNENRGIDDNNIIQPAGDGILDNQPHPSENENNLLIQALRCPSPATNNSNEGTLDNTPDLSENDSNMLAQTTKCPAFKANSADTVITVEGTPHQESECPNPELQRCHNRMSDDTGK